MAPVSQILGPCGARARDSRQRAARSTSAHPESEAATWQHFSQRSKTMKGMVFGTRILKYWVLEHSGFPSAGCLEGTLPRTLEAKALLGGPG